MGEIVQGLLAAMFSDGRDALTPETAVVVVSIGEEYTVLGLSRLNSVRQSLVYDEAGNAYDALETVAEEGSPGPLVWFDVTAMLASAEE
ncbi:MAG: hypothetical protein H6699_05395 [Myxococcales bacterium]|nr:hypothetical protein [Myxococcales bacterium]